MKYLLYYKDGFIKKFPLKKSTLTLGRGKENDLVIEDGFLSRKHLKIKVERLQILIKDLNSTNGTFVNHGLVSEARLKLNDSFTCGGIEFFLKHGSFQEFKPAKELIPIFKKIRTDHEKDFREFETRDIQDIYHETLKQILQIGMKKRNLTEIMNELASLLSDLNHPVNIFLVSRQNGRFGIQMSVKHQSGSLNQLKFLIEQNPSIFTRVIPGEPLPDHQGHFSAFPIESPSEELALITLSPIPLEKQNLKFQKFLLTLSKEISLLTQLYIQSGQSKPPAGAPEKTRKPDTGSQVVIVAGNKRMRALIEQTRKIATSDLFILIEGESGTGKELFARLIHENSTRQRENFVALNCAAIPENLLESELFGYAKGAFTGAYTNKAGKLELASGGTLVLDEIGNMSLPLQAKLLRVLQEYEFYRLGSTVPIKVELRIISLTNVAVNDLLNKKKIREDLFYRIAHHIISIPALRERQEDIPSLINHFTEIFSRRINKKTRGYAMEAFEALQRYHWPGNVRQLENEVKRLVNLVDEDEMIEFDLLSEMVKSGTMQPEDGGSKPAAMEEMGDRDRIISLLKQYNWNKSRTARAMRMTYQGLHKKMKKLGIERRGR